MCIVYQAWDTRLQRYVAVKRLEPPLNEDPRTRARFDREGRALAQLSHPNLVTLIDRGTTEDEEYLVFEYVEGRSLKDLCREGPLSAAEAGGIAGQIAEGLAVAHLAGIVHRDVKPQNVLIDREGHAKVGDFGIATGPDWTRVTRAGSIIGSARYMSPEQVRSKPVDGRSDVYSLGVVLYEMLAGHPPFDGINMPEIARQHLTAAPQPLSEVRADLPPGLDRVVARCLEKLPEDRFSSMDELLGALVGLGLYLPERVAEISHGHRRLLRRREDEPVVGDLGGGDAAAGEAAARVRSRARKKRLTRGRTAIAAATVVVVALAIVLAVTLPGKGAPLLMGKTLDQAQQIAKSSGFQVEVGTQVPSFDNVGKVINQTPAAGKKPDDGIIRLTVTRDPIAVKVTKLQDVDPQGDAQENHAMLPKLIDGNDSTGWATEYYRSANFGNLGKTGVGIDFTLDTPATIVEVVSPVEGWKGELLSKTSSGVGAELAPLDGVADQRITLKQPISAGRIWITQLVELKTNRYGVQLGELRFYR